jgi:hypothetical protein
MLGGKAAAEISEVHIKAMSCTLNLEKIKLIIKLKKCLSLGVYLYLGKSAICSLHWGSLLLCWDQTWPDMAMLGLDFKPHTFLRLGCFILSL